jgi:hypothetical protein
LQVFGAAFVGGGTSTSAALITADTTNFDGELSGADTNLQTIADRIDDYDSILNYAGSKTYRPGNVFLVTDAGDEGIWQVNPASGFTSTTWGTDKSNCTRIAVQAVGNLPIGSVVAWQGGYYTNGSNAGFTNVLGNTVANANAYLNPLGVYVCDGAAVNDAASPIFNGAGRYLPNLTDSRFLMGSTTAGGIGGDNAMAHTHSVTSNVAVSTQPTFTVPAHYHNTFSLTAAGQTLGTSNVSLASGATSDPGNHNHSVPDWAATYAGGTGTTRLTSTGASTGTTFAGGHTHTVSGTTNIGHTHGSSSVSGTVGNQGGSNGDGAFAASRTADVALTNNAVTSGAASNTENRPLYLSAFYVMRIK